MKPKVAIACQGGGSQTAFTAGVLKSLFENGIQDHYEIVSLSGTSGGAICAFLTWYALKKGESPLRREFTDLRKMLEMHADFDEVASWEPSLRRRS